MQAHFFFWVRVVKISSSGSFHSTVAPLHFSQFVSAPSAFSLHLLAPRARIPNPCAFKPLLKEATMTSVSYANIAAAGTKDSADYADAPDSAHDTPDAVAEKEQPQTGENDPVDTLDPEQVSVAAPPAESPRKEKKALAPAPVPSKSAWGASAAVATASVDEHKWPTPDKAPTESTPRTKFVKANKWIPIPAKVVMPSGRTLHAQFSPQKTKRKNKPKKKDDIIRADDDDKSDARSSADSGIEARADARDTKPDARQDSARPEGSDVDAPTAEVAGTPDDDKRYKNYKRYGNGHGNGNVHGNGNANGNGNGNANGPASAPRFYPQFVPSQYQYPRQYKPSGYRRNNNATMAYNGYMAAPFVPVAPHPQAMMPMPFGPVPVQIPPPISPKQNPQQALTQQIDYYFLLDNLIRDVFLRRNMGTEGWVELDLILNFKRIKIIVNGIHNAIDAADEEAKARELDATIMRAVQQCQNVEIGYLNGKEHDTATATEVQLRVRHSFEQWLFPDN